MLQVLWLTVRLGRSHSKYTTHLASKKSINIVLMFDLSWQHFLLLNDNDLFHWLNCCLFVGCTHSTYEKKLFSQKVLLFWIIFFFIICQYLRNRLQPYFISNPWAKLHCTKLQYIPLVLNNQLSFSSL